MAAVHGSFERRQQLLGEVDRRGLVQLRVNGVFVGSAPLVNGRVSTTVRFKKGNYSLTATYVGDPRFNGSSGTVLHRTR